MLMHDNDPPDGAVGYEQAEYRMTVETRDSEDLVLVFLGTHMVAGELRVDRIAARVNGFWHVGTPRPASEEAKREDYSPFLPRMIGSFRRLTEELVRNCEKLGVESVEVSQLRELIERTVVGRGGGDEKDADVRFY
jgi:hypothetical protein